MELAVFFSFGVLTLVLIWVGQQHLQKTKKTWAEVAQRFDFEAQELSIRGTSRDVRIDVFREVRGSGKHQSTFTVFTARLDLNVVPVNLTITEEGFFSKVGKLVGGDDVQLGLEGLDERLLVRGYDPAEIRRWAGRGDVSRGLQDVLDLPGKFEIESHMLTIELSGLVSDADQMVQIIETMVSSARALSGKGYGALLYDESW